MAKITYDNKSTLNPQPSVADVNKVTSGDMNEIKSVVNTNYGEVGNITNLTTPDKTSIVNAINSMQGIILWANENPTTAFGSKTISLSTSNYDILEVFYVTHVSNERNMKSIRLVKGFDGNLTAIPRAGGEYTREFNRVSDTSYTFSTGYTYTSYMGGKTPTQNVCLPLYVIGYNTGLF